MLTISMLKLKQISKISNVEDILKQLTILGSKGKLHNLDFSLLISPGASTPPDPPTSAGGVFVVGQCVRRRAGRSPSGGAFVL